MELGFFKNFVCAVTVTNEIKNIKSSVLVYAPDFMLYFYRACQKCRIEEEAVTYFLAKLLKKRQVILKGNEHIYEIAFARQFSDCTKLSTINDYERLIETVYEFCIDQKWLGKRAKSRIDDYPR